MNQGNDSTGQQMPTLSDIFISIRNIGGISSVDLTISPGVTVLSGRNATNRTSLLRAIAGAIGGTAGRLKRDAENGSVEITISGEEYIRQYSRHEGGVRTHGEPYTSEEEVVDLFVCLLEDNPIRRAVRDDKELSELLLAPVDTKAFERQIADLQSERTQIDEQLNEIKRERKRLPKLQEQRRELQDQLDEIESELEVVREQVDGTEPTSDNPDEAESVLEELERTQEQLQQTESEIKTQRRIRDELKENLVDVREELSELEVRQEEMSELEREIDHLRGHESELSATINELSTILTQNKGILSGEDSVVEELAVGMETVDELDPMTQSIECWTCGNETDRQTIGERIEDIESLLDTKRNDREQLRKTIADRESSLSSIQREENRRQELEQRERELEEELNQRTDAIDDLTSKADDLRDMIADLQVEMEGNETVMDSDAFKTYERMSELEYERGQLERELSDIKDDINEIEYLVSKQDDHEARRAAISDQITSLRRRIEEIEKETVETFNTHIDAVLDRLDYNNIERIWLERRDVGGDTRFDLHIVREDDDDNVYEDTVTHLSESEREVVGLIISLVGYLTHDVQENIPLILIDSVEAIDARRIRELVEYFRSHTEYLVLALLEEDASVLPENYDRVLSSEHLTD